jgi:hypothetical protein
MVAAMAGVARDMMAQAAKAGANDWRRFFIEWRWRMTAWVLVVAIRGCSDFDGKNGGLLDGETAGGLMDSQSSSE